VHRATPADDTVSALDPRFFALYGAAGGQARIMTDAIANSVLKSPVGSQFKRNFPQTEPTAGLDLNAVKCEATTFVRDRELSYLTVRFRTSSVRQLGTCVAAIEIHHEGQLIASRSLLRADGSLKNPPRSCDPANLLVDLWNGVCLKPIEDSSLHPISFRGNTPDSWNADPATLATVLRALKNSPHCYLDGVWVPGMVRQFLVCCGAKDSDAVHVSENIADYLDKFLNVDQMAEYGKGVHELTWSPGLAVQVVAYLASQNQLTEGECYVLTQYYSNYIRVILHDHALSSVQRIQAGETLFRESFDFPGEIPFLTKQRDI
jgi:hypothetical protein